MEASMELPPFHKRIAGLLPAPVIHDEFLQAQATQVLEEAARKCELRAMLTFRQYNRMLDLRQAFKKGQRQG
jgi:hypothetical protein